MAEPLDLPEELAKALADASGVRTLFESLPASHKREYATWVGSAKKAETRARRAAQAVTMIRDKDGD